ncbi:MAG: iron ABC transporter permease [Candidatus Lernaella stagnicola]|nr:iron ABC transporter permease [Candidatus Lernaella stagnicola]
MQALTPSRFAARLAPFVLFLLAVLVLAPLIGNVSIDPVKAWTHRHDLAGNVDASILWLTRVPRVLLAGLVGAALALAGATLQALLRNPLAEPFTLGVSSGGAFGAVVAIKLGLDATVLGFSPVMFAALLGSIATVGIVYALARTRGVISTNLLLLAGVTISFFFAAEILLVFYLADFTETHMMLRWMMGSLDVVFHPRSLAASWGARLSFATAGLAYAAGIIALLAHAGALNQLSLGPEIARSRGVNVRRVQRLSYFGASLITGLVVALAGPIGFVGLIVPHAVRFLIGPDHRVLLPASLLAGAGFLILCDTAARSIVSGVEIPVGVLTATLGGPFFLGLLIRAKHTGRI